MFSAPTPASPTVLPRPAQLPCALEGAGRPERVRELGAGRPGSPVSLALCPITSPQGGGSREEVKVASGTSAFEMLLWGSSS